MAREFRLPQLAEGDTTGTVSRVLVAPGDQVAEGQNVLEVEAEKALIEVPCAVAGTVEAVHVLAGDEVQAGTLLLTVSERPGEEAAAPPLDAAPSPVPPAPGERPESSPPPGQAPSPPERHLPTAPAARRLARELGVEIAQVPGSGPGGRISAGDVATYAKAGTARGAALPASALPDFTRWGPVRRKPMSRVRRATAEHLSAGWPRVPQVTQFDAADVTDLESLRQAHAPAIAARGGKLTVTALLLKVCALALRRYPKFNASLDLGRNEIVHKQYCHIGVAVDTERGLLVPVVHDVDRKSISELAVELQALAERARQGRSAPEEMQGGSFSISNLGGIGGTGFTPLVNYPESAILGVARSRFEPRWDGKEFAPRLVLPLSLSYDHRLIDGAEGARFLRYVCEILESPFLLVLEG